MKLLSLLITLITVSFFAEVETVPVDITKSTVQWEGSKLTGKHQGTINLIDGNLAFTDNVLTGGSFTLDMTTITNTDLDGGAKGKLEGHLKSADFFGVDAHPTSKFVITLVAPTTKANEYEVKGNITIKGTTQELTFKTQLENGTAKAKISIDRTRFGVKYGSGSFFSNLGDSAISDEFILDVMLVYTK